ncbi:MAG: hypothetical protein WAX04_08540 [Oscillospiraceae bacterium]
MTKIISAIISLSMLFGTSNVANQVSTNVPITVTAQQAVYAKYANGQKLAYEAWWQKYATNWDYISKGTPVYSSYEVLPNSGNVYRFMLTNYVGTAEDLVRKGDKTMYYRSERPGNMTDILIRGKVLAENSDDV